MLFRSISISRVSRISRIPLFSLPFSLISLPLSLLVSYHLSVSLADSVSATLSLGICFILILLTCPPSLDFAVFNQGNRVDDTHPAQTSSPRSASAICGIKHQISRVESSRVTCGSFTNPFHSVGTRNQTETVLTVSVEQMLYGEELTATRDENPWL